MSGLGKMISKPNRLILKIGFISLLAGLFFIACERGTDEKDVRQETKEMVRTVKDIAKEKQAEYQEAVKTRLENIHRQLDELRQRTETLGQVTGAKLREKMDTLSQQYEKLQEQFSQMKSAGKEKWEQLKTELDQGMNNLEQAYQDAAGKFNLPGQDSGGN